MPPLAPIPRRQCEDVLWCVEMTSILSASTIDYPGGDGQPLAETYWHVYALLILFDVLTRYLAGQQALVLANQFLYYAPAVPTARVAPDVMVVFGVAPGPRINFKTWEEGRVPSVIFEVTSPSTRNSDMGEKMTRYALLGVQEYWLFDPRGEWLTGQLQGYRLVVATEAEEFVHLYEPIEERVSQCLNLRLEVGAGGYVIDFYRLDNGEKLLISTELSERLQQEQQAREAAEQQTLQERQAREAAEQRAELLAERLRALGVDPENL